eukprot:SAG31_NODE_2442_length_5683_cov_8.114792_4_plen_165_part_00
MVELSAYCNVKTASISNRFFYDMSILYLKEEHRKFSLLISTTLLPMLHDVVARYSLRRGHVHPIEVALGRSTQQNRARRYHASHNPSARAHYPGSRRQYSSGCISSGSLLVAALHMGIKPHFAICNIAQAGQIGQCGPGAQAEHRYTQRNSQSQQLALGAHPSA